jgi:xanthine dehydrogenase accessory factor
MSRGGNKLRLAKLRSSGERPPALIKGAGDLATGVALRLFHAGFSIIMTETPAPAAVRRTVAFSEAVYEGRATVEGVCARLAADADEAHSLTARSEVAVVVDPRTTLLRELTPALLVDAIVAKRNLGTSVRDAPAVIALGPGFVAGRDAHAVIETCRGHSLGRVITEGSALPNTGVPGEIGGQAAERVLRAPIEGVLSSRLDIGDCVHAGDVVAHVDDASVVAPIGGVLRGLLRPGMRVTTGMKLGDIDPCAARDHCYLVSDKARAVAGGVLEAACNLLGGVRFD